jgi:hypothetical protein
MIVGVLNERRGFKHLDFWSKPVFGALFVFYRARVRVGCMGWHGALEHGIRARECRFLMTVIISTDYYVTNTVIIIL